MSSHPAALLRRNLSRMIRSLAMGRTRRQLAYRRGIEALEDRRLLTNTPFAEAGAALSIAVGETITLSAAGSTDSDGPIATYAWDLDNDGEYDDAIGLTTDYIAVAAGTYTIGLEVTDDQGATGTDATTITVYNTGTSAAFEGYNLFSSLSNNTALLVDNDGNIAHSWATEYRAGNSMYLLENGELLTTGNVNNTTFVRGGQGGIVQTLDWDGNVTWEYQYSSSTYLQHHDVEMLPNGNVLMIAWQYKTEFQALSAGRDPALLTSQQLWPDSIIEVQPTGNSGGNIVWEWHVWDHLVQDFDSSKANYGVVADHPELVDLNFAPNGDADWLHFNSVDYNSKLDQIVLSVHSTSEIWIIDHSTTTVEAASHSGGKSGKGGDLLFRWGNPQAYGAGTAADQQLFRQHNPEWIQDGLPGEGNILLFNNGLGRPGSNYSSVDEIITPVNADGSYNLVTGTAYGPENPTWSYTADNPTSFYSRIVSSAQRLPNGNTLIDIGTGASFFEVNAARQSVWDYQYPDGGLIFRVLRYAPEYSGFDGTPLDDMPVNQKPTSEANGPYFGNLGDTITLSAAGSLDTDGTIIRYAWDLDQDGQYDDATGVTASFNLATAGVISVGLRVTDDRGATSVNTATVTVDPHLRAPTIHLVPYYPDRDAPTITWSEVSGATGYEVWLTQVFPANSRVLVPESNVSTTAFTPSLDLDPGYYKVWVRAVNATGVGGNWSAAMTFEIRPKLGTSTITSIASPPTFTWAAIPNAPGYQLFIQTYDGVNTVINNITTTSYTPTQALSRWTGRWWIRSSNAIGNLGWSLAGTFNTRTRILAPDNTSSSSPFPTFNWVAVAGGGNYILHVKNLDTNTVVVRENNLTDASYTPETAFTAGNYRVWVKAMDGAPASFSSGLWSDGVDFSVSKLSRPAIQSVPHYPATNAPTIKWSKVTGAAGYEVWLTRVFPAMSRILVSESRVSTTQFTPFSGLDPGYYKVWVQAVDSHGVRGTWSTAAAFEIRPDPGTPTIASFTSPPTFTWTAIPNAPSYQLYVRTDDGISRVFDNITATSYTPTAALSQKSGRWWIRSSDATGNFGWSRVGTFGIRTEILAPVGTQGTSSPTFNWIPIQGAGRYILHVTNLDTNAVVIRKDNLTNTSYTPSTTLAAGRYRAWVKGIDRATDLFSSGLWSFGIDFSIAAADAANFDVLDNKLQFAFARLKESAIDSREIAEPPSESSQNHIIDREMSIDDASRESTSKATTFDVSESGVAIWPSQEEIIPIDAVVAIFGRIGEILGRI